MAIAVGLWRFAAQCPVLRALDPAHFGARRLEGAAPDSRPGQGRDQQDQCKTCYPEARHRMQIAPDNMPTALEARPYHAGKPTTARPPQIEARETQHKRPTSGQFDQTAS